MAHRFPSKTKGQQNLRLSNIDQPVSKKWRLPIFNQACNYRGSLHSLERLIYVIYVIKMVFFYDLAPQLFVKVLKSEERLHVDQISR